MTLRPTNPQAPPEGNTQQFSAFGPPTEIQGPGPDDPPAGVAGLSGWRQRGQPPPASGGLAPPHQSGPQPTDVVPRQDTDGGPPTGFYRPEFEDSAVSMPGLPLRRGVLDGGDPQTELVPAREGYEDGDGYDAGYQEGYEGDYDTDYDDGYGDGYDDYDDGYDELEGDGYGDGYDEYYEEDAYPDEPQPQGEAAEEGSDEPSPAKQWLALAAQLALGVVGGAGVWLGFNWLWGQLPAAATIAALVVTVCLVWIVRKVRKAEDLQTTLLAILVGMVVTVSPAALLLVAK